MNAICNYDFTSFESNHINIKEQLRKYCKSWDFQQEQCPETQKLHFQGRFSLKVKERLTTLIKKFPGYHLTPTSTENINNNYYVTKEDTRVDGPWSSDDVEIYIPRQIREITQLREWQQQIVDSAKIWDTRTINIIIDFVGNNGKTTICSFCGVHGIGRRIPFSNDFRDIMRMIMDTPDSKMYLFDIPRALRKDQLYQFYAGIEEIKNGYAFDDRYKFREKWFDSPTVWVFTNAMPDTCMLSGDRWRLWTIKDDKLIPFVEDFEAK